MMDEDYTHWICINRATTISNDSTKQTKKCKDLLVYISYHHASVYTCTCIYLGCVYTVNYIFLPIHGGSEVYIPYKLFSKVCNVYLVVLKKKLRKKIHLPTNIDIAPQLGSVTICDILLTSRISSVISI